MIIALIGATVVGLLIAGVILRVGLPHAGRKRRPWKWILGIGIIALSFVLWPPAIIYVKEQIGSSWGGVGFFGFIGWVVTIALGGKHMSDAGKTGHQQWADDNPGGALVHEILGQLLRK